MATLSDETKKLIGDKVRAAFAAKRLAKENAKLGKPEVCEVVTEINRTKPGSIIYVSATDRERLIEMGKAVQEGKVQRDGYAMGEFIYKNI